MTNGLTFQNDAVAALLRASETAAFSCGSIPPSADPADLFPKAAHPFIPPTNLTRPRSVPSVSFGTARVV